MTYQDYEKRASETPIHYQYGPGVYGGSYPDSELGFQTDRELRAQKEKRSLWSRMADEIASWFAHKEDHQSAAAVDSDTESHKSGGPG